MLISGGLESNMELGAREMLTFATVLCGLAGTWAVIKSTVARIQEDLKGITNELASLNTRLDATESGDAVIMGNILQLIAHNVKTNRYNYYNYSLDIMSNIV